MIRPSKRFALVIAALAVAAVAVAGCAKAPVGLVSVWPQASVEATVSALPEQPKWPLTGLDAPGVVATKRRPLSIKVENLPAARPQTGLNSADVVYETVVEGGITRFHLVFQSKIPGVVGPVRSARLSDLWIVPQYHGVFFFSGASSIVSPRLRKAGFERLPQGTSPYAYYRTSRPAPHNLYLDMTKAWADVIRHKYATTTTVPKLQFGPASELTSAAAVSSVYVPLSSFNNVTWTYDAKRDMFLRQNNHVVHRDAGTGKQVAAKNVVVMWAKYSSAGLDKHGGMTYDIKLGGSGRAVVFRNGTYVGGKWTATRGRPPHFTDTQGRPLPLSPGNTWFEVVALDVNISMK